MVTIGSNAHVLALVRAQLERMARTRGAERTGRAQRAQIASAPAAAGRIETLAGLTGLPERTFERALVGALLTEEFGADVTDDPRFQAIIDRTAALLHGDPALTDTIAALRGAREQG